ncbi:MAG: hybrid sensor histidine kinase/response regulator [Oceanospirillales bacterium]|nr:MAG: hybrid sensor histidine kinase/response regulator [Oceanospirillales bacterium]
MSDLPSENPTYETLLAENQRLKKINAALIERVEAGSAFNAAPYAAFEHSASLAEQVRDRTEALSVAMAELRQTNHALKQANLSRTKFLAAVSHDLLQPLNAARLFTGALLEKPLDGELKHLSESIHRSLQDVDSLLGTLVDMSRLDAGVINPDISIFPISDLLDNLAAEFTQIGEMEQRYFRYHSSSSVVSTDLVLLARILRNFLTNAVRYTPPHSRILLGCRRRPNSLEIQVVDSGIGIAEDQLEHIFEEFRRIQPEQGLHDRGLGLGLAIVEKIAGMLGHQIRVKSIKGKGSLFSVTIPLAELRPSSVLKVQSESSDQQILQDSNVWVLDNDPAICTAMLSLLTGWGCKVKTFQQSDALDKALAEDPQGPDLLIADYHLDESESGLDAIQRLQQRYRFQSAVLMITANYTSALRQRVRSLGFRMLNKPVKPLKLKVTIAHLLRQAT